LSARRSAGARRNARCGQAHQVEAPSEDWDDWNAWADVRIAAALEQHEKLFAGRWQALGEIRADLRREFRNELESAAGKLGVELRELIAGSRTELACLETELARRLANLETQTAGLCLRGAYRGDS
jgi:hypothetical protein